MSGNKKEIDGGEFVQLITANQRRIYAYILTLVPNMNDADDVLQETTATMWQRKGDFQPGTDFVAWGARIAYFKVLDYRKKSQKAVKVLSDKQFENFSHQALEQSKGFDLTLQILERCIKKLSEPDRLLINMRYSIGVTAKEISTRVNKSVRSVYLNLARIQSLLLECIERSRL